MVADNTKARRPGSAFPPGRWAAFAYNIVILLVLIGVAIAYMRRPDLFTWLTSVDWRKAAVHSVWFAILGGVAISLKGIYDHPGTADWGDRWMPWYIGRPFSAAIVGVMTYLLLQVANTSSSPSIPTLAVAAFFLGTQERRFFGFVYEVAKLVLSVPGETGSSLSLKDVQPRKGKEGDVVVLTGQGMVPGTNGSVAGRRLSDFQVSTDGLSAAGRLPVQPSEAGPYDVVIANPDGTAYRLSNYFTYS